MTSLSVAGGPDPALIQRTGKAQARISSEHEEIVAFGTGNGILRERSKIGLGAHPVPSGEHKAQEGTEAANSSACSLTQNLDK